MWQLRTLADKDHKGISIEAAYAASYSVKMNCEQSDKKLGVREELIKWM